jgi:DNA-binding NarL/FixJ family response regulator
MLKTMLVEDNIVFRTLLKDTLLSGYPSMEVLGLGSGEEAEKRLGAFSPDLIFMDINLPGENGLQTTQKIKQHHPDTAVVILTSYDFPEYREAAIKCGADGFIAKSSLDWNEMMTMVKCHGESRRHSRNPACIHLTRECEILTRPMV